MLEQLAHDLKQPPAQLLRALVDPHRQPAVGIQVLDQDHLFGLEDAPAVADFAFDQFDEAGVTGQVVPVEADPARAFTQPLDFLPGGRLIKPPWRFRRNVPQQVLECAVGERARMPCDQGKAGVAHLIQVKGPPHPVAECPSVTVPSRPSRQSPGRLRQPARRSGSGSLARPMSHRPAGYARRSPPPGWPG